MRTFTLFLQCLSVCLLLSLLLPAHLSAGTDEKATANPLESQYVAGIETAQRKLQAETAHRTALASRLDDITTQLTTVQKEQRAAASIQTPLVESLLEIEDAIKAADAQIQGLSDSLSEKKDRLKTLSPPTLLATALQQPAATQQQRQIAVQHYLIHKSHDNVEKATRNRRSLMEKRAKLMQSGRELNGSIGELSADRQKKLEERRSLENEFTQLSASIVEQQDRVEFLQTRLADIRRTPDALSFAAHRGTLSDPTPGVLEHRFAEPKARGLLQWEGILVGTPDDQHFSAVFDGTVVFADSMQCLGNVTIIDHGDGYMSLYGMADLLIVETGQFVLAGDILGSVGRPVGATGSRLYFEIRHNANTLDPQDWLAMRKISPN